MFRLAASTASLIAIVAAPALAECPPADAMYAAADAWIAGERLPDPAVTTLEDGACAYQHFREGLEDPLGAPVGVKVGFTSKPAQQAFGVPGPVAGALFADMILPDGAPVSLAGSRSPFYEADLIVTVGDTAIAEATTRDEVAAALDEVRPFVELPDLALAEGLKPTGPIMAAYGVLPWRGVLGEGIKIADLPDPVADLGALTVDLRANGESVGTGTGDMLLGHPLDVVLWLIQQGSYDMPAGTMISLGSLGQLTPATPGLQISADYMVGGQDLSVSFDLTE
ncbi:2-keto-4-pentenoate hydratase [Paracoccus tegillarcae]|uniref:Hydratase n=1 Tax=Paracoccus tegillarcae TaxID=1529068 RepID=A0A2K9ECP2_9RHOB|nr:hydratase [Paracoccus tegillarcae]AUH32693.1 hydratase [Paracoccus tegillarcae]